MKLEKYLADYLAYWIERLHEAGIPMNFTTEGLEPAIQQGIEAFESTENAKVDVRFEDMTCEHSFIDVDNEGAYGFEGCRFCGWREHK